MGRLTGVIGTPAGDGERLQKEGPLAWAASTLRRQEMPSEEIRAVLAAQDRETVRRYLELHRERLEERLAKQRRALADLERFLIEVTREPHQPRSER